MLFAAAHLAANRKGAAQANASKVAAFSAKASMKPVTGRIDKEDQ
jgi:hypothetical protein